MKKITLLVMSLAMIIGLVAVPAMAKYVQAEAPVTNPITSGSADEQTVTDAAEDETIELLASVVATVDCPRQISVTASRSSPAYLYRSPTTTTVTDQGWD